MTEPARSRSGARRQAPQGLEPYVDAHVVAEFLSVAYSTVQGWASRGKIPCHKRNGSVRFRLSEVDAWLREGERKLRGYPQAS